MTSEISLAPLDIEQTLKQQEMPFGYPIDLLLAEIAKIQAKFLKSYDPIAQILALARPIVEVVMMESGYFEVPPKSTKGRPRLSRVTLVTILLLEQIHQIGGDRQMERELGSHPAWLHALGLKKAPDHDTLGKCRNSFSPDFFGQFFHKMTALLFAFGIMTDDSAMITDSAPIEANQNFARSNALPKIDDQRLDAFFNALDLAQVLTLIASPSGHGRPIKYSNDVLLRFLIFEKVCGFLSRSQALKYLTKHSATASLLGFDPDDIPTLQNLNAFLDRIPPINWLIRPLVDQITDFFDAQPDYDENDPLSFFFWNPSDR
jgi:transposase